MVLSFLWGSDYFKRNLKSSLLHRFCLMKDQHNHLNSGASSRQNLKIIKSQYMCSLWLVPKGSLGKSKGIRHL